MPTADPVTTLDGDILLDIAGYLSISDLASAACVSRAWRGFFRGQDRLWRSQYLGLKDVDSGLRWRHKIEGRERERRGEDPVDWHALCFDHLSLQRAWRTATPEVHYARAPAKSVSMSLYGTSVASDTLMVHDSAGVRFVPRASLAASSAPEEEAGSGISHLPPLPASHVGVPVECAYPVAPIRGLGHALLARGGKPSRMAYSDVYITQAAAERFGIGGFTQPSEPRYSEDGELDVLGFAGLGMFALDIPGFRHVARVPAHVGHRPTSQVAFHVAEDENALDAAYWSRRGGKMVLERLGSGVRREIDIHPLHHGPSLGLDADNILIKGLARVHAYDRRTGAYVVSLPTRADGIGSAADLGGAAPEEGAPPVRIAAAVYAVPSKRTKPVTRARLLPQIPGQPVYDKVEEAANGFTVTEMLLTTSNMVLLTDTSLVLIVPHYRAVMAQAAKLPPREHEAFVSSVTLAVDLGDQFASSVAVVHGPRVAVFTSTTAVIFEDSAFEPLPAAAAPRLRATILKRPERSWPLMHLFVSMDERAIYEIVSGEQAPGASSLDAPEDRLRIISFSPTP